MHRMQGDQGEGMVSPPFVATIFTIISAMARNLDAVTALRRGWIVNMKLGKTDAGKRSRPHRHYWLANVVGFL